MIVTESISERLDVAIDAPETIPEIHMDPNPQAPFTDATTSESASPAIPDTNTGTCPALPEPMPLTAPLPESPEAVTETAEVAVAETASKEHGHTASGALDHRVSAASDSTTDTDNCILPAPTTDVEPAVAVVATAPTETTTTGNNDSELRARALLPPIDTAVATAFTSNLSPIIEEPEVAMVESTSERLEVIEAPTAALETSPEVQIDPNPQASSTDASATMSASPAIPDTNTGTCPALPETMPLTSLPESQQPEVGQLSSITEMIASSPAEGDSSSSAADAPPKGKLKRRVSTRVKSLVLSPVRSLSKTWKKVKSRNQTSPDVS